MKTNKISKEQALQMIKSNLEQGNSIPMTDEGSGAAGAQLVSADGQEEVDNIVNDLKKKEFSVIDINELKGEKFSDTTIHEFNIIDDTIEQLGLESTSDDYEYCVCFANTDNNYKQYYLIWE
nr:hypothetical protein [uncultured Prevotella sp.]